MLNTYATVPLILNLGIHAFLALRELVVGTGLVSLIHRRFPSTCSNCGYHMRSNDSAPVFATWFRGFGSSKGIRLPSGSAPKVPVQQGWNAPPWVGQRDITGTAAPEQAESYHDEPPHAENAVAADNSGKGKNISEE